MPTATCPICERAFAYRSVREARSYPFCGENCRLIDLGAWYAGVYSINRDVSPTDLDGLDEGLAADELLLPDPGDLQRGREIFFGAQHEGGSRDDHASSDDGERFVPGLHDTLDPADDDGDDDRTPER